MNIERGKRKRELLILHISERWRRVTCVTLVPMLLHSENGGEEGGDDIRPNKKNGLLLSFVFSAVLSLILNKAQTPPSVALHFCVHSLNSTEKTRSSIYIVDFFVKICLFPSISRLFNHE